LGRSVGSSLTYAGESEKTHDRIVGLSSNVVVSVPTGT
jgi:hypothetical protein